MNSRIKSKRAIYFGKVLPVTNMYTDESSIKQYENTVRKQNPNISEADLINNVDFLIRKDSYYNAVMDEVASAYEFELDESEVNEGINDLSRNNEGISREHLEVRVKMSIYRKLIYDDLSNSWNIVISDDEVKNVLEEFYRSTGQPIREYLMDKEKFEDVRETLKERVISDRLMNAFVADYKTNNRN